MSCYRVASLLVVLLLRAQVNGAFVKQSYASWLPSRSGTHDNGARSAKLGHELWMGKVKRGGLGSLVEPGTTRATRSKKVKRRTKSGGAGKKDSIDGTGDSGISPALAEWMSSRGNQPQSKESSDENDTKEASPAALDFETTTTRDADDASTFTAFEGEEVEEVEVAAARGKKGKKKKNNKSPRRSKQSERAAADRVRDQKVRSLADRLEDALTEASDGNNSNDKKKMDLERDVLEPVRQLMQLSSGSSSNNFRQLAAGAQRLDYRLAWVGSDAAVCHVGTGLHKVPLARLQEVFLSLTGRNQVLLQEVIRVIGPFPNVRNTLRGLSSSVRLEQQQQQRGGDVVHWIVKWDSMVDGGGKELLADGEEKTRRVDLQVYFADPSVIVAVVPSDPVLNPASMSADPLEGDGENVLVFLREEFLDDQLEKLRVA